MRTHVTEQMIDLVIGRRIFTLCWFCAAGGLDPPDAVARAVLVCK